MIKKLAREFTIRDITLLQQKMNRGENITPRFIEDVPVDKKVSPFFITKKKKIIKKDLYYSTKSYISSLLGKHYLNKF